MNTAPKPARWPIVREDRSRLTGSCQMLRRIARDDGGAIAVIFAVAFPVLAAILSLGIETGIWYAIKRQDQSVADLAAYSGALEVIGDPTKCTTGACPAAVADAKTNGFDFNDAAGANAASTVAVSGTTVTVTLKHDQTPMMVSYFLGNNTFQIANQAVASVASSPACASSVAGSGTAMGMSGGPTLTMPGCTLTSNSTDPASIDLAGNATINAFSIYTVGGVVNKGSSTLNLTQPAKTSQTALKDPYCLSATNCMSVPSTVTGFTMPDLTSASLASTVTSPTFPTNLTPPAASDNTNYPTAPPTQVQPGSGCDLSASVNSIAKSCYASPTGTTFTGGTFSSGKSPYFILGPVTITGAVTINSGVDIYIAGANILTGNGLTVASGGSLTVNSNGGKPNGSKADDTINVATGNFDASAGTVTFTGDTSGTSAYALNVGTGKSARFGTASFGGGSYAFYGGNVVLGAGSHTTTLGAANYKVVNGNVTVSGTAKFDPGAANSNTASPRPTNLTISAGTFTSASGSTVNFCGSSNSSPCVGATSSSYALSATSYNFGGNTTFGNPNSTINGANFRFDGAALTIAPASGNTATMALGTYYVTSGDLAFNGPGTMTVAATTSSNPTTLAVVTGNLTNSSALTFTGGGTSQYNICNGAITSNSCASSSAKGVVLGGQVSFGAGTYYFMNGSSSGGGLAVNGGTSGSPSTFAAAGNYFVQNGNFAIGSSGSGATVMLNAAGYSVQNGNFSVGSGSAVTFNAASGASCGTLTASCLYVKTGSISNAGTATFASGTYYLYDPNGSGTSFTNSGTMTLGTSGSNNFYISNAGGAFRNAAGATLNFGSGNYYIKDGTSANGNNAGGFANLGTLNFRGDSGSTYYFINGPSFGTGTSSGTCSNSTTIFGALSMMGGSTTNLGPANYYLLNGDLCINQDKGTAPILTCGNVAGGAACAAGGAGITFILTGNADNGGYPGNVSTLQIPSNIATSLNAPGGTPDGAACAFTTPGCYAGVLFFQDPDRNPPGPPPPPSTNTGVSNTPAGTFSGGSCSNHSNCSFLDGGDAMALTGAVYIPQSIVDFKSNNSANTCLVIIAKAIIFSGNSFLTANGCSPDNVKTLTSKTVALTQ